MHADVPWQTTSVELSPVTEIVDATQEKAPWQFAKLQFSTLAARFFKGIYNADDFIAINNCKT